MINLCTTRGLAVQWLLCLAWLPGCHRQPPIPSGAPLEAGFQSPEETFATWVAASLAGDREAIRACYFDQIPEEELSAWITENLRPEAKGFFDRARLVEVKAVRPVEVLFLFQPGGGADPVQGTMVLARNGWKILRW